MQQNRHGIRILQPQPRLRVRQCFKLRHADRASAFDHLVALIEATGDPTLKVYRCRWCRDEQGVRGWHIGHPQETRRRP
jgi:hypothetical protein